MPPPPPRRPPQPFRLIHRTADAWDAVAADIAAATRSIAFEQYILDGDRIGDRILHLMAERAWAGVRVRVLLDAFGSAGARDAPGRRALEDAGGRVRFYNPLHWRTLLALPPRVHRDHRKLVLVDDAVGYVGGVCFQDRMADWRDTMMRVSDPHVAAAMAPPFETAWARAGGTASDPPPPAAPAATGADALTYLVNSPEPPHCRDLFAALVERIDGARRSIDLTTPYFLPQHGLLRRLTAACRRGVRVRLVLPGVSDHPPLDIPSRAFAGRLARAGGETWFFRHRMMHAKLAVVDDRWASVGSLNLDRLSTRLNLENGIVSERPDLVTAVAEQVERDVAASDPAAPAPTPWHPVVDPVLRAAGRFL